MDTVPDTGCPAHRTGWRTMQTSSQVGGATHWRRIEGGEAPQADRSCGSGAKLSGSPCPGMRSRLTDNMKGPGGNHHGYGDRGDDPGYPIASRIDDRIVVHVAPSSREPDAALPEQNERDEGPEQDR